MSTVAIATSRRRIAPFRLHRPASVAQACALLHEHRESGQACAGGIDLVSRLKDGRRVGHVVALDGIAALRGVSLAGDALRIGALTRHWQIERDVLVRERLPSLARFVAGLGNVRVRMQGTIGGNVMAGEPLYEMLPALAALDATLLFAQGPAAREVAVPAVDRMGTPAGPSDRLLVAACIPLGEAKLAWNRDLRAAHGLECVAAVTSAGGRAVLIGDRRGGVAAPLASVTDTAAVAADWIRRLPPIESATGASAAYCRTVAPVLLRRALASAGIGRP